MKKYFESLPAIPFYAFFSLTPIAILALSLLLALKFDAVLLGIIFWVVVSSVFKLFALPLKRRRKLAYEKEYADEEGFVYDCVQKWKDMPTVTRCSLILSAILGIIVICLICSKISLFMAALVIVLIIKNVFKVIREINSFFDGVDRIKAARESKEKAK